MTKKDEEFIAILIVNLIVIFIVYFHVLCVQRHVVYDDVQQYKQESELHSLLGYTLYDDVAATDSCINFE